VFSVRAATRAILPVLWRDPNKVVSAAEAVAIIRSGDMIATSGFVGVGTPEAIYAALAERFLETGQPRGSASSLRQRPVTARGVASTSWRMKG
jgi:acyl CoA:acetate/3-ketoacid CoA transferase